MDKDFLKKAISEQLQAINEQLEVILGHDKRVPQIELDIIMSYTREFYEYLYAFNKENSSLHKDLKKAVKKEEERKDAESPSVEKEKKSPEEKPAIKNTHEPAEQQENKPVKKEDLRAEPESEEKKPAEISTAIKEAEENKPAEIPYEIREQKEKTEPVEEAPEKEKKPAEIKKELPKPAESKSTKEIISEPSETLADKLIKEDKPRLADKIQKKSLTSLKKAIGINEKFLFINELFRGKMGEYNKAIDKLDECLSLTGCREELEKYAGDYQWDRNSEPFKKLHSLIIQKFES